MEKVYIQECEIEAAADTVFGVLTDFAHYPQWNPWIVQVTGEPLPGRLIRASVSSAGKIDQVQHRILAVERPGLFSWCDIGWFTVFTRGERIRRLRALADGRCHYRCELRLVGPCVPLVHYLFGRAMRAGMAAEAAALAQRCRPVQ